MQWILNNLGAVFIAIMIGSSFFGWLAKQLKEQAELKRIETEKNRRRQEALRTGRDPDAEEAAQRKRAAEAAARAQIQAQAQAQAQARSQAGGPPGPSSAGRTRLEEIAARRQAQLEELRRRRAEQLARSGQGNQSQAPGRQTQQPARQAPARTQQPQQQPQRRSPKIKRPTPPQVRPQPTITPTPQIRPTPAARETVEQHHLNVSLEQRHLDTNVAPASTSERRVRTPADSLRSTIDGGGIRDAILLAEIIAPPVSMREHHLED